MGRCFVDHLSEHDTNNCLKSLQDFETDPMNCGSCGVMCDPDEDCVNGSCQDDNQCTITDEGPTCTSSAQCCPNNQGIETVCCSPNGNANSFKCRDPASPSCKIPIVPPEKRRKVPAWAKLPSVSAAKKKAARKATRRAANRAKKGSKAAKKV